MCLPSGQGFALGNEHESVDQAVFCYTTANTLYRINEVTKNIESQLGLVVGLLIGSGELTLSPQGIQKLADDYVNGRLDRRPPAPSACSRLVPRPVQSLSKRTKSSSSTSSSATSFNGRSTRLPVKIADKQLIDAAGATTWARFSCSTG